MKQAIGFLLSLVVGSRSIPSFASPRSSTLREKTIRQQATPQGRRRPPGILQQVLPNNKTTPSVFRTNPKAAPNKEEEDDECHYEAHLCVGPSHDSYPLGHEPGVIFTSRFQVPPLPRNFQSDIMTYYDYYNVFWRQQPQGGIMNQLVPQLMLGNVLANSSNFPNYEPQWLILDQWHIGAQYFFALPCNTTTATPTTDDTYPPKDQDDPCWIAKAATGNLIPVQPGQVIETTITLVEGVSDDAMDLQWHLRMGVVGSHHWSLVVVETPFMGLVANTTWTDDIYQNVTVGSCLENYNMHQSDNYPTTWEIVMDVLVPDHHNHNHHDDMAVAHNAPPFSWDDWRLDGNQDCDWLPQSSLASVSGSTWQRVTWNATLQNQQVATQ
jgi:hypothetical protein